MDFILSAVQLTCIVLAGLMTLTLAFFVPHFTHAERIVVRARQYLTIGAALITIHFIVQYFLHITFHITPEMRTIINLLFGFPISYCTNISLLYLQRQGKVSRMEWLSSVILYIPALICGFTIILFKDLAISIQGITYIMSLFYALLLIYYHYLQLKEYIRIRRCIKTQNDRSQEPLIKWTKWSMFLLIIVSLGLPIMTFSTNPLARSFYGIYSISIAFFYIFSFIGYNVSCFSTFALGRSRIKNEVASAEDKARLEEAKSERITQAVNQWVESQQYLQSGITMKDVVSQMGVSRYMLNAWLQTTEYKQFNTWLMNLRIEEAKKQMLEHSDWSNETIARVCGFSDRSYFQRQFREIVGTSPSKWIKENDTLLNSSTND